MRRAHVDPPMDIPSHGRIPSFLDQAAPAPAPQSALGKDYPKTAGKNGRRNRVVATIDPE
jgi:hypothetical protein